MCGGQVTPAPDVILSAAIVLVKVNPRKNGLISATSPPKDAPDHLSAQSLNRQMAADLL